MSTAGFDGAPITKYALIGMISSSLVATATNSHPALQNLVDFSHDGHQLPAQVGYLALHVHYVCYANPVTLLVACVTVYHLRVVERLWGTRRFGHFLLTTLPLAYLLPPLLTVLSDPTPATATSSVPGTQRWIHDILRLLPPASIPTTLIFAVLAQYHTLVPWTWRYSSTSLFAVDQPPSSAVGASEASGAGSGGRGAESRGNRGGNSRGYGAGDMTLKPSSKNGTYLLAAQLALSQFPISLVPAVVGWVAAWAWEVGVGVVGSYGEVGRS